MTSPFPIAEALARVREAVQAYPPAALFQLAEEGFRDPFAILVACIVSVRTLDEVTIPVARRLFQRARRPCELAELPIDELARLLQPAAFADRKAHQLSAIAQRLCRQYHDQLPCDETLMRSFPGVGPKCTNLVLGIACGIPRVAVDVHVHRITNRWGLVRTQTPEQTLVALERVVPQAFWVELNRLLVPFGKHICTGRLPRCSSCPLRAFCPRIGVTRSR